MESFLLFLGFLVGVVRLGVIVGGAVYGLAMLPGFVFTTMLKAWQAAFSAPLAS